MWSTLALLVSNAVTLFLLFKSRGRLAMLRDLAANLLDHPPEQESGPETATKKPHFVSRRVSPGPVPSVIGACGIHGCPNVRPHSHVEDLVRRLRGK